MPLKTSNQTFEFVKYSLRFTLQRHSGAPLAPKDKERLNILDARVHCAVLKLRTNPPKRPANPNHTPLHERGTLSPGAVERSGAIR